jgi:hypothetical protein
MIRRDPRHLQLGNSVSTETERRQPHPHTASVDRSSDVDAQLRRCRRGLLSFATRPPLRMRENGIDNGLSSFLKSVRDGARTKGSTTANPSPRRYAAVSSACRRRSARSSPIPERLRKPVVAWAICSRWAATRVSIPVSAEKRRMSRFGGTGRPPAVPDAVTYTTPSFAIDSNIERAWLVRRNAGRSRAARHRERRE